jgi:IS30 family transposase
VPALERLTVRQISSRFLSQEERIEIADLRHAGLSIRQIAQRLGRAPSTVSRELRRQRDQKSGLPSLRCAPLRDCASDPRSSATDQDQQRTQTGGRGAAKREFTNLMALYANREIC